MFRTHSLPTACIAGCLVLATACGPRSPVTPETIAAPLVAEASERHAVVVAQLGEIVNTMEQQWYRRDEISWSDFRSRVFAKAEGAETLQSAYPAIQLAFEILDDSHSRYTTKTGTTIGYFSRPCGRLTTTSPATPSDIGYVRVGGTGGVSNYGEFAGAIQAKIRDQDRDDLAGWIIDLRGNSGGSSYAMIAGVGPILGTGIAGYFSDKVASRLDSWGYYVNGSTAAAMLNESVPVTIPTTVYTLKRQRPRVAILSDRGNASAGEATLIGFVGRENTRIFGTESCGLTTGVGGITMSNGAVLDLARSRMGDRTGRLYNGPVPADEQITNESQLFARAIAWLRGQ